MIALPLFGIYWHKTVRDLLAQTPLRFARAMTWHGKHPLVRLIRKSYRKGVTLTAAEMRQLEAQVQRLPGLEKWFVDIPPSN